MGWVKTAYGLSVAAVLAGGTAIYYYSELPRHTIAAVDFYELAEGVNERIAALGDDAKSGTHHKELAAWPFAVVDTSEYLWPHTNAAWNFSAFIHQPFVILAWDFFAPSFHVSLSDLLYLTMELSGSFVRSVDDAGAVTYWTAPELFRFCGVGPADGTNAWFTLGVTTSGPVYIDPVELDDNALWVGPIWTGTLHEVYRLLAAMTTTAHAVSWGVTTNYFVESAYANQSETYGPGPTKPAWAVAFTNAGALDGVPTAGFQEKRGLLQPENPVAVGAGNLASHHSVYRSAPQNYSEVYFGKDYWYIKANSYGYRSQGRRQGNVPFRVPNMASGVVASLSFPVSTIGALAASNAPGVADYSYYGATQSFSTNWTFPGPVATGWYDTAVFYPVADLSVFGAAWSNEIPNTDADGLPQRVWGEIGCGLPAKAVINWTFTRCKP